MILRDCLTMRGSAYDSVEELHSAASGGDIARYQAHFQCFSEAFVEVLAAFAQIISGKDCAAIIDDFYVFTLVVDSQFVSNS